MTRIPALLLALVTAAAALATPASAHASPAAPRPSIVSASVSFDVVNGNETSVACSADGEDYVLRGQLVGPRTQVLHGDMRRVNLLVHGLSTGSWLWSLPHHAGVDYARHLAARGEVSLVIDRLGYGQSTLADPKATCLGAQASMLHQVVQELMAGMYHFTSAPGRQVSVADHVVLQGHAVGAAIAEIEAATYHDVSGLVVMSWADEQPSSRALQVASRQQRTCMTRDRATYGDSDADFRSLLFATASASVQAAAVERRVAAPCGDATSLAQAEVAARQLVGDIAVPVLVLHGSRDALISTASARAQAGRYGTRATLDEIPGAGSALPLEHAAPVVRRDVLAWLHQL